MFRQPFLLLFSVFFFLLAACQRQPPTLQLFQNGQSAYEIRIETPDAGLEPIAQELKNWWENIGGVKLNINTVNKNNQAPAIRLRLAATAEPFDPLRSGHLHLLAEGPDLILEGSDTTYLRYAMYELLERYAGCRWLDPETDFVPQLSELTIPADLDYRYQPDIATRTVHSRLFYENPAFARKLRVTTESFPYYVPTARVHTFHRFLPEADFYREHPEYYALRDGRRLPTQLCLTNETVFQLVRDSVRAHFSRYPEAQVLSVSTDDNTQYCTCENCSRVDEEEGSHMGSVIRFVNRIAEAFPDKTISTLAYQYTRAPGKTPPRENVLITLCSIECDRSAPIAEKCTPFADDLHAWRAMDANLRIWDYTTQFTNFLAPFPNLRTLQPNIQLFRNTGARWIFEQHSHHPSELFELRSYLMAKLLWNPEENVDSLIQDFTAHYYEAAGPYIVQYIEDIHAALADNPDFFLFLYGDPSQAFDSYLSAENLLKYQSYFDSAEAKAAGDPALLDRVRRARLSVDYATLEACRKNLSADLSLVAKQAGGKKTPSPAVTRRLENFEQTCQKNHITLMNEMGYTVAEYIDFVKATLGRAQLPNIAEGKPVTLLTQPKKYAGEDPQTLTDGAFGGNNFYANWLGFEGPDLVAEVDLGSKQPVSFTGMAFLQVVNHLVFFPTEVTYSYAGEDRRFRPLGTIANPRPLTRQSKINDVAYFDLKFSPVQARYLKVEAKNMGTPPYWHHGAGLPAWLFADEWVVKIEN